MEPKQPRDFPPVHEPPNPERNFQTPRFSDQRDGPKPSPSTSTSTRTPVAGQYEPLEFYGARAEEPQGARSETDDDVCELNIKLKTLELEQLIGSEDPR